MERLQNDTHRTQNAAYDAIRTLLDGLSGGTSVWHGPLLFWTLLP